MTRTNFGLCSVDHDRYIQAMKRRRVLAEPDAAVVIKLKSNPGQWYAIADANADDLPRRHTLGQVAYRIRKGEQGAFNCGQGSFDATVTRTPDETVELRARYLPSGFDAEGQ
jgi:hypothetical protein